MKKLIVGLVWLSGLVLAGCGGSNVDTANTVAVWDTIAVNYVWSLQEDKSVFDTSIQTVAEANEIYNPARPYEPLSFTVGAGQMIPGFDSWVVGMAAWESKTITIAPADGYGERTDEAIQEIPSAPFEEQWIEPIIGEQYNFGIAPGTVLEVGSGTITVDFNHFLAGQTLVFDITVETITKPSEDTMVVSGAQAPDPVAPTAEVATWS